MSVFSKYLPNALDIECSEIHVWTDSCLAFAVGLFIVSIINSFRTYCGAYLFTLLMKGRIPRKEDIEKTILGILQSTAFLSGTAFGYSLFLCFLRRILGNFNILTVSALPAFLSSAFSILIERPSRRTLLCLYVSNVATETIWNMLLSRNLVKNIKYGDVAIFCTSMALLLMYYKDGRGKSTENRPDSMFGVLRFVVGPYEEKDYSTSRSNTFYRQQNISNDGSSTRDSWRSRPKSKNTIFHIVTQALRVYRKIIYKIKCCDRHHTCPHPFSCLYYTMQGIGGMFSIGLGIQLSLKLILNLKKIIKKPIYLKETLFKKDTVNLACFLAGFSGLFRATLCVLRRVTGKDSPKFAIPAGLLAGVSFINYPDKTVALYVMWKAAQITYNMGIEKGILPRVPGFTEFLYCFSTAILFHAALLEPTNLRPSYWKFLHSISGGRIACMNRAPLDAWGLGTSESLKKVLELTKTQQILK